MPTKQFLMSGTSYACSTSGVSYYSTLLGDGNLSWSTLEAGRTGIVTASGKLSNFQVGVAVAPGDEKSWIYTVRKNEDATSLSVTISGAAVLSSVDSDEVTVAVGDRVCIEGVGVDTPAAAGANYWTCQFTPDTDGETILLSNTGGTPVTADRYFPLIGGKISDDVEFDVQTLFPTEGTLKNFYVQMQNAPGNGNSAIFTIRKNEGATSLVVTISGGNTTGSDTDPAHNIDIAAGDRAIIFYTVVGAPAASYNWFGIGFLPNTQGEFIASATTDNITSSTAVEYQPLNCADSTLTATESEQHNLAQATTVKKIYVNLSNYPNNGYTWVFTLRRNATTTTNLTVSISNLATSGNAAVDVAISAADLLDTMIDATAGTRTAASQIAYLFYNAPTAEGWANIKYIRAGTGSILATDLSHIWFGTTPVAVADIAEFGGVAV